MTTAFTSFIEPQRYAPNRWSSDEAAIDRWINEGGATSNGENEMPNYEPATAVSDRIYRRHGQHVLDFNWRHGPPLRDEPHPEENNIGQVGKVRSR
jgi:hypothetical protein